MLIRPLLTGLTAVACAFTAFGQSGPRVAIAAAAANDLTDCRYVGLQQKLMLTQRFSSVDILDVVTTTPLLQQLESYDAIITWSNVAYADSVIFGDNLAAYVDGGGGVVVAGFATYSTSPGHFLDGRWLTGGYEIIRHTAGLHSGTASLGLVLDPTHPVAENVSNISGMFMARPFLMANWGLAQGRVVLEWDDGRMMAAVSDTTFQRVDLGLHPVDSDCVSGYLDSTGDGVTLIANALMHTSGGSIASNYCTAMINSSGRPARMIVQGSTVVTDNDFTLVATDVPLNAFGFFLGGRSRGTVPGFGGGQGVLCLQANQLDTRQLVQNSGAQGQFSLSLDPTALPVVGGTVSAAVGETWHFQGWFRDTNPQTTSNLTDGASVIFQ